MSSQNTKEQQHLKALCKKHHLVEKQCRVMTRTMRRAMESDGSKEKLLNADAMEEEEAKEGNYGGAQPAQKERDLIGTPPDVAMFYGGQPDAKSSSGKSKGAERILGKQPKKRKMRSFGRSNLRK